MSQTKPAGSIKSNSKRGFSMRKLYVVALAVVLLGISPIFASDGASLQAVPRPFVPNTATLPGILITTVSIGASDQPPMPCWNCVTGATVTNLGIAEPLSVVPAGSSMTVTLTWDDLSYSGAAQFAYAIRSTLTATPISAAALSADIFPSGWWGRFIVTVPSMPGAYLLQGSVTYAGGTGTTSISVPLIIQ
jgi:hypothetical protein